MGKTAYLPIGIVLGAGVGAATGNLGLWLGVGIAIGAALMVAKGGSETDSGDDDKSPGGKA